MPRSLKDNLLMGKKEEHQPGFLSDVSSALKKRGTQLKESAQLGIKGGAGASAALRTIGSIAGAITDVGEEAVEHTYKALGEPGKETVKTIGKTAAQYTPDIIKTLGMEALKAGVNTWNAFKIAHPDAAKNIEATANIAEVIPMVKGATSIGRGLMSTAKKTSGILGRAATSIAESGNSLILPPAKLTEANALRDYLAKNTLGSRVKSVITGKTDKLIGEKPTSIARTITEQGLRGTKFQIGVQATRLNNEIKNIITPVLEKSKAYVTKSSLFNKLHDYVQSEPLAGRKEKLMDALMQISDEWNGEKEFIQIGKLDKIKTRIGKLTPPTHFTSGKDIANEYKEIQDMLRHYITDGVHDSLGGESAKKLYSTWSKLIEIAELGSKSRVGAKPIFGSNFIGALIDKTVVPIGTTANQMIYSLGNMLQFKGRPGYKKFGDMIKDVYQDAQQTVDDLNLEYMEKKFKEKATADLLRQKYPKAIDLR